MVYRKTLDQFHFLLSFVLKLIQLPEYGFGISVDTDGSALDLFRTTGFIVIDTGVDRLRLICRHSPEGILDDDRGGPEYEYTAVFQDVQTDPSFFSPIVFFGGSSLCICQIECKYM